MGKDLRGGGLMCKMERWDGIVRTSPWSGAPKTCAAKTQQIDRTDAHFSRPDQTEQVMLNNGWARCAAQLWLCNS